MATTPEKSGSEVKTTDIMKPTWLFGDKSLNDQNESVRNNITPERNIRSVNLIRTKKSSEGDSNCKNINIHPNNSENLQGMQTDVKGTALCIDNSDTSKEYLMGKVDLLCNEIPHNIILPVEASQDNTITLHGCATSSCSQTVSCQVSPMGRDVNKAASSNEIIQQHQSGCTSNHSNPQTNHDERELPGGVKRTTKAQLINETVVASTSNSNDDSDNAKNDELVKNLTNGVCDINNQGHDSDDVKSSKNSLISNQAADSIVGHTCLTENMLEDSTLINTEAHNTEQMDSQTIQTKSLRRLKSERNTSTDMASDDSSDEDIGVYPVKFLNSNWVCEYQKDGSELKMTTTASVRTSSNPLLLDTNGAGADNTDGEVPSSPAADDVFSDQLPQEMCTRSGSTMSTLSETEFKHHYVSRRKCLIQRANSQQEYHRLSSRIYDHDRLVVIERISDSEDLGLHLLDSYPAFITSVDPDSAAEKAGVTEGQILVSVNGQDVLTTKHADIVKLIHDSKGSVTLGVANSDFQPVRDLQAAIMSGYMYKLGNSALKIWKRRYFLLRQDNCLYYYRNSQETDPLGAFPLGGYTITRHTEANKEFCFKAEKFGGRMYFFYVDTRDELTVWVGALTEASVRSTKRKESFLSVSSHNVGLPALHILKPECAGILGKLSPSRHAWRRRYCVLKDACVYYYKDKSSSSALGVIHLHGYKANIENYQRRKYSFSLLPPEKKMKVFAFCADNETDKNRWVDSLIHSIQRWAQVDKDDQCS